MAESIIQSFVDTAARLKGGPAARYRKGGKEWVSRTWAEMDRDRLLVGAGLLDLGFAVGERACILSNTTYEWMLADLAIQSCGGETVPVYQSLLPSDVEYIANDSGSVLIFCEDQTQLDKLKAERAKLDKIRKVIVMNGETDGSDWTVSFPELMKKGEALLADRAGEIEQRTKSLTRDSILTLIYTSGTTGKPKGVVLTHANMLYEIDSVRQIDLLRSSDVELLFLPMAHSFAKVLQCCWFGLGHEMAIDGELTRITQNLGEVRPTVVASVPRIFEKVYAKVVGTGVATPGLKGKLFRWAVGVSDRHGQLMMDDKPIPFGLDLELSVAKRLVFSKVNAKLSDTFGGRLRFFVSGGAPLPKKMAYFFANAGVTILEGYGLTETSAAVCVNRPTKNKIGTVGPAFPGSEIKIAPDGEILIRGPGVMREYWGRVTDTADVLAPDGWFATGDVGVLDADGYLKITDRKKDIIVTAGGKNVAPQNIENLVKSANPLISQVMIHGDKRKFLSALVTLDPEHAKNMGKERGLGDDYATICRSEAAKGVIQTTIDAVNDQLAQYEKIKKFQILDADFQIGVELTPTLKVKRKFCNEKYRAILDGFYDERVD